MFSRLLVLAVTAFAACAPLADRVALTPVSSSLELRPLVGSAMVRTVSLPTYAAVEEIAFETTQGRIMIREDVLWADEPERAVTLILTRTLSDILNTDVGPDPWPFVGLPDVSVDIRVSRMLGGTDGTFELNGQFFVASEAITFRDSSHIFEISEPMADASVDSISAAQSAALLKLAEQIAATLGR
ncbi:PqiC family protein [Roseobacter sp. CCS2]|uniref:PqiC family protein n=1 Tax=Roseobacter sp. CCS2 TaxID=391593 RepID=UPI0000F3FDD5|nr:PqiC family protein [Roseobacter sp. CCS2]EBA10675.1 lipoprotein, putative [Roseobacter sp. CCS2]